MTTPTTSTSSTGEKFPLPVEADYQAENDRLSALVAEHKELGHEIFSVRHDAYQELEPEQIIAMIGNPAVIIDWFAMLSDTQIKTFFAAG